MTNLSGLCGPGPLPTRGRSGQGAQAMQKLVASVLLGGSLVAASATGAWGWQSSAIGAFSAIDARGDIVSSDLVTNGGGVAKHSGRDGAELWRNSSSNVGGQVRLDPSGDVFVSGGGFLVK